MAGQLLTPLTRDLADDAIRGGMDGIVASGLLSGILASRTVSGLIASTAGWQATFFVAAALTAIIAVVLWRVLPEVPARTAVSCPALIAPVFVVAAPAPSAGRSLLGPAGSRASPEWTL